MRTARSIACVLALLVALSARAEGYSLDDLRALERQEGWAELLAHAKDLPPSRRDAEWERLVEKAALGLLAVQMLRGEVEAAAIDADRLLFEHAFLKRSRRFLDERARAGLAGLERCFRSGDARACLEKARVFVRLDPDNARLAFDVGKSVRAHMAPASSISLFLEALERRPDRGLKATICSDPDVELATRLSLGGSPEWSDAQAARKLAFSHCFDALKGALLDELVTSGSATAKNACPGLAEKGALTPFQAAYCKDQLAR